MYARALEHQRVGPPTALLWVVEVVGPGTIGLLALGDTIRSGWGAGCGAGGGCGRGELRAFLAMSPTQQEAGALAIGPLSLLSARSSWRPYRTRIRQGRVDE